ncbi:hypothetical protein E4T50_03657 [Aureobasidium sp. EXF-12298]|nr:hypothetical protein E4T50_03657 [Aureobasidium sp. EXF-12298]
MVCGTMSAGAGLATILVPAIVVPFVLANVIGWTIFGVHKHRKHKRQREGRSGGDGSAAGAGNTFVASTGQNGETVVSVVPAGAAAGSSGGSGGAGGAGGSGGTSSGASYTTGGVPVQRQEVVQTTSGAPGETVIISTPQAPAPHISAPQAPKSLSPPPQPAFRDIPFRHVKPFVPAPQHIEPPPAPASPVEPTEPSIASIPTIEIMPPRKPTYQEYLLIQRENARTWSDAPSREHYPPPARDYPSPSRDHPAPAEDLYPAPRQDYSAARDYPPPIRDTPAPFTDYPAPVRENPAHFRDSTQTYQDYPSTLSSRSGTVRNALSYRDPPAPLAHVKPPKRRVSFSGEDEVATLPPDLPSGRDEHSVQGLSRMRLQPPNLSGMPTVHDDYEYEKQRNRTYIDPAERPYVPEPKWTPLSESPARELPLVEDSYAHGPYRAENSPTPSMQVHVDKDDFVLDKGNEPRKNPHQYGPQQAQQNDRTWTRYVTVKGYRDEKGPFVEVEEKFVFDDER